MARRAEAGAPAPAFGWDDMPLVDRVAATLYNAKAQSPREMTAERWFEIKRRFRTTARILLEEAQQMIDDGELE